MGDFKYGGKMLAQAVDVDASAKVVVAARQSRSSVTIQNAEPATNVLFIGHDSNVTSSNGLRIGPGESITIPDFKGPIYGIADTADTDVRTLEVYD